MSYNNSEKEGFDKSMKFVIISGGHIDDAFALNWLKENKYDVLMAADSGMNFLHRNHIMPDIIAGDFDSVDEVSFATFEQYSHINEMGQEIQKDDISYDDFHEKIQSNSISHKKIEMIRLNPIKDDTDTEFVIREAIRRGATKIVILGATGTRLDHVLANIYLLGLGLEHKVHMELVDAYNRIRMINDRIVIAKNEQFGNFVSVLPIKGDAKGVTLEGMKYPLKDAMIPCFSSLGVSNEIVEEWAKISVEQGTLLVIESRDKF